jgi:cytochrome c-type biogenesis protein CcmE
MTMLLRWGLPAVVVAGCVGYLIYSASGGSTEYYVTVSELQTHAPAGDVRVAGVVQNDVQRSGGGLHVTFTEKDGTASMPVDITVVAEGRLAGDGVFHARTLLAKCPSRFSNQPYTQ